MKFFKEFRDFAVKGNVIDLAVGVIIGGAFGKIVTSLVNDIIMPLLTFITRRGQLSFENLFIALDGNKYDTLAAAQEAGASTFNYGLFLTNVLDFLIISLVIFIFIRQINRFRKKPEPAPVSTKECPYCRTAIHKEAVRCPNCTSDLG
ncbi:MAG TPA: large conductance mechanosensitive channel protein MscL [Clostridiales bacterium]|nr:large conductance mechanosensitive channel protein MscL [Clostridiaceae bacterium]HPV02161.1 large conductance mechanosensitive channel protein MscL [Clostridiales bacterium]